MARIVRKPSQAQESALLDEEVAALRAEYPAYIEHGSAAHRQMLGVDDLNTSPARAAELEQQLNIKPVIQDKVGRKKPVNRENYRRREQIVDGWYRKT